jgi:hypothetical protein
MLAPALAVPVGVCARGSAVGPLRDLGKGPTPALNQNALRRADSPTLDLHLGSQGRPHRIPLDPDARGSYPPAGMARRGRFPGLCQRPGRCTSLPTLRLIASGASGGRPGSGATPLVCLSRAQPEPYGPNPRLTGDCLVAATD